MCNISMYNLSIIVLLTSFLEGMIDTEKRLVVLDDLTFIEAFEVILGHFFIHIKLILTTFECFFPRLDPLERKSFIRISKWQSFKGYIITKFDFLELTKL